MDLPDFVKIGSEIPAGAFSEYDMMAILPALQRLRAVDLYLEVGVDNGRSLAFARLMSKAWVYGIDIGHKIDSGWFKGKRNWEFIHAPSNEAVKGWKRPIDVLFIDGDHSYEGVKDDWNNFSSWVRQGGTVYFHDCDETSPGVVQLFNEIGRGWKNRIRWIDKLDGRKTSMASVVKS